GAAWRDRIASEDRAAALAAIGALPDSTKLEALRARGEKPEDDVVRLLRLRVPLLRGEQDQALALLDAVVRELDTAAVTYAPAPLAEPVEDETEVAPETEPAGDTVT